MEEIKLQGPYEHRSFDKAHKHKRHHHYHVNPLHKELMMVTMISNPIRYDSRYKLYRRFLQHMHESGATVFVCEVQTGNRTFQITEKNNPLHLQLRSDDMIWHKERAFNLSVHRISTRFPHVKYFGFIDADIEFTRKDWQEEALNQLQIYDWVQGFSTAVDIGPNGEALSTSKGFMYSYLNNIPWREVPGYGSHWHPGYIHFVRKEALNSLGQWIDGAICGSADYHSCCALIGQAERSLQPGYSEDYRNMVLYWQDRAERNIKRNVGYMNGNINHFHHGPKSARGYNERWKLLVKSNFSPFRDLYTANNGLYQLDSKQLNLRDNLRAYMSSRDEDSKEI